MTYVTIIQQGTSPKAVEANEGETLRDVLEAQGIDTGSYSILRAGAPAQLDNALDGDVTVTATKKSVGA